MKRTDYASLRRHVPASDRQLTRCRLAHCPATCPRPTEKPRQMKALFSGLPVRLASDREVRVGLVSWAAVMLEGWLHRLT